MPNRPTIHILGAGALGSLWAAKLSKSNEVILILRNKPTSNTYTFHLSEQNNTTKTSLLCESATSTNNTIDILLVFTKSYDTLSALCQLKHRLSPSSQIVLFQNGMGSQQTVIKAFPHHSIYAASTTEGANRPTKETVIYAGKGETWIGDISKERSKNKIKTDHLAALLSSSTLDIFSTENIWQRLWVKLAINCAINPFTALLNCKNGEIRNHALFRSNITPLCQELSSTLQLNKIALSAEDIQTKVEDVLKKTASNISSMLQDVRMEKQTEIEFINGYIELVAKENDVSFPVNLELLEKVRQKSLIKN